MTMSTDDHPDIFADFCEGPSTAVPLAQPAPPFDPWGMGETAASRVMRQMAAGQEQAARAAAESDRRDAATREAVGAASDGGEGHLRSSEPASARVVLARVEESAQDRADQIAELKAERERQAAQSAAHWATVETQDADFHVTLFHLGFTIAGVRPDGAEFEIEGEYPPAGWDLSDDTAENARLREGLEAEISAVIAPWVSHYHSLGLVRADLASFAEGGGLGKYTTEPTLCLVHRAEDADLPVVELAQFPEFRVELASIPGATLSLSVKAKLRNATMLHDTMRRGGGGPGQWSGEATPQLDPAPDESRDEWLERVCLSRPMLGRLVERWVACGRNPYLFARYGDWTERADRSEKIEWVVNGVIPRKEVIVLAGASGAGKSSVVHSWLGALGARSDSQFRHVLGIPITGRFVCALVAGEESAGSINYRAAKHASAWGPSDYLTLNDPDSSLADHIESLDSLPNLDLVVVDTVGAFFDGDPKSDRAARAFLAPLVRLARVKNCAVILVNHLTKFGEGVKSIGGLKAHVLGAGAFVAVCRLAIGVIRVAGKRLEVGPFKANIPEELLWLPEGTGCRYQLNDQAFTLDPILEKAATGSLSYEVLDLICDAIAEQNRLGRVVRRTGRHELWERKLSELEGVSRAALRAAIIELVDADRIIDGPDGLVAVFPTLGGGDDTE